MEILTTVIGAAIALVGTYITGYYSLKKTKISEENNFKIMMMELDKKIELESKIFENNVLMNNRQFIPEATKTVLKNINELYNCTEELVLNYPGTPYTGSHPGLLFGNTLEDLGEGFPDSRKQLIELDVNWVNAYKNFNNALIENRIFLSSSIQNDFDDFERNCKNIKDYFYGYYSGITNEEEFRVRKEKYNEQVKRMEFVLLEGIGQSSRIVLSLYDELKKSKISLVKNINDYQKEKTKFE